METTSDDLVILERAVGVFTDKLNSVRAYMVSYNQERRENSVALAWGVCQGMPWEPHIKKLDLESQFAKRALRNVTKDWDDAKTKENERLAKK
jgi:hypothetical protein